MGQYLKDRKGFKKYDITDGEKSLTNPLTLHRLLHRDTINNRGWGDYLPFLVFEHIVTTHHFNPTQYFRKYQDRKVIQDKVWELHIKGWGYTKIHHYLVNNNYEVGKSRTVVDSMIKKRIKKERILNQPVIIDRFVDFRMEVLRN